MKKLLSIVVAAFSLVAMAEYTAVQVGVTDITTSATNTIVPVAFKSLATGGNIAAKDLVKTTGLKAGTWLLAYTGSGSSFNSWTLKTDGGDWEGTAIATIEGISATAGSDSVLLNAGSAVWIILPGEPPETTHIYVYGAYAADVQSTITAGSTALVANPKQANATPSIANPDNGDVIGIVGSSTVATYTYKAGSGWGYYAKNGTSLPTWTSYTLPSLPIGGGFWYTSKGSRNVTISWNVTE